MTPTQSAAEPKGIAKIEVPITEALSPNSRLSVEVIKPTDLFSRPSRDLLPNLNDLINDAYSSQKLEPNSPVFGGLRIQSEDQLVHELGPDGLLAICIDESIPEADRSVPHPKQRVAGYYLGRYGRIVATAGLKHWKGRAAELFRQVQQNSQQNRQSTQSRSDESPNSLNGRSLKVCDWEVATCASVNDPKYRRQGLMIRCVDALVNKLVTERKSWSSTETDQEYRMVKLWLTALEGSGNTEYWTRRGFVKEGEADVAPKGMWTSDRDFKVQTLSKIVPY